MMSDIEAGKIGCVITKDLSRLGRNYIESGSYMEVFFPKHNVRYIAIADNYDSLNKQEMDIAPFKNILNDMYSRDISKKVLAGRNQEIDDTFINLYVDKVKGILTEKRFLKLTDVMEKEQESNQNRMQEIAAFINDEEYSESDVQMFMGEIRRYAAIMELDEMVLNRLIN